MQGFIWGFGVFSGDIALLYLLCLLGLNFIKFGAISRTQRIFWLAMILALKIGVAVFVLPPLLRQISIGPFIVGAAAALFLVTAVAFWRREDGACRRV